MGHPYYIVAPSYDRKSMGIKVLHYLCDRLNRADQMAFLLPYNSSDPLLMTSPFYLSPLLDRRTFEAHFEMGLSPIVIYPEIVSGNPLGASTVVRYVLNVPGFIAGDLKYDENEIVVGFSEELSSVSSASQTLTLAPWDLVNFYLPEDSNVRYGSCFYSRKHRMAGNHLLETTSKSVEVDLIMTPREIGDLFRRSEVFYAYESTALIGEAILCGCPVVLISNPHFDVLIGGDEVFSGKGFAWDYADGAFDYARDTVDEGRTNLLRSISNGLEQLDSFIEMTQRRAQSVIERKIPDMPIFGLSETLYSLASTIASLGVPELFYANNLSVTSLVNDVICEVPITVNGVPNPTVGRLINYQVSVFIPNVISNGT